jgi:formyltetrahydrofolate deformylase
MLDPVDEHQHIARLLVSCPDRHGIVAAVSGFLSVNDANILSSDQHSTDREGGTFFMRMEFHLEGLMERRDDIERAFAERVAKPLEMDWRFAYSDRRKRTALLASRDDHCLLDLLWRWRRGELETDVACVVSNHPTHAADAAGFGVPYHHVPVTPDAKAEAEAQILEHLADVDLVVLARYMQILSPELVARYPSRIINIHHSFLPAFAGAGPYERAKERGVKLIGATAHYVTEELDQGPIIEQDVIRVSHRDDVAALIRLGADIERTVLGARGALALRGQSAREWRYDGRLLMTAGGSPPGPRRGHAPGTHVVPASGTRAIALASNVSATRSSGSRLCRCDLPQARASVCASSTIVRR